MWPYRQNGDFFLWVEIVLAGFFNGKLLRSFTDSWQDKWTYSEHPGKEFGKFERTAGKFFNDEEADKGKCDVLSVVSAISLFSFNLRVTSYSCYTYDCRYRVCMRAFKIRICDFFGIQGLFSDSFINIFVRPMTVI